MVTEKSVHLDGHHYRCIVIAKDGEWEVRQEPDTEAVARLFRRELGRIECALMLFEHRYRVPQHLEP